MIGKQYCCMFGSTWFQKSLISYNTILNVTLGKRFTSNKGRDKFLLQSTYKGRLPRQRALHIAFTLYLMFSWASYLLEAPSRFCTLTTVSIIPVMRDVKFSQPCCFKHHLFRDNFLEITWPWRGWHYELSKPRYLVISWHRVASQKTWFILISDK